MGKNTLSIMPYYGGKARMAQFIVDRLNYDDSDIYIEPFGGACRTLLNKPRHKVEIYNDYGEGVSTVMYMLSDWERARDYIYRLYETEYSEEQFNWAKEIYDSAEINLLQQSGDVLIRELKSILVNYGVIHNNANIRVFKSFLEDEKSIHILANIIKDETTTRRTQILKRLKDLLDDYNLVKDLEQERGLIERSRDIGNYISDMDLAVATYVLFTQSRDSMGKVWSSAKFKSTDQYRERILRLFDCAQRMEGVLTYQIDAMDFFRWHVGINRENELSNINKDYKIMLEWIHDPKVMMYCDPSYISPEDEEKLLKGIDWRNVDNISEEIKKRKLDNKPSNLGKVYAMSFEYEDHENFLKCIYDAGCKIMVSNYDLKLYNKYLTPANNWRRIEFETTTSVGGKAENRRTEVIWYNY